MRPSSRFGEYADIKIARYLKIKGPTLLSWDDMAMKFVADTMQL